MMLTLNINKNKLPEIRANYLQIMEILLVFVLTYCPPRGPLVRSDFPAARQQAPNQHCAVLRAVSGSSLGFLNDGIPVSKMLNTLY